MNEQKDNSMTNESIRLKQKVIDRLVLMEA